MKVPLCLIASLDTKHVNGNKDFIWALNRLMEIEREEFEEKRIWKG